MNCWHCERPSHAACRFCGRAVCRDHVRTLPHPTATWRDRSGDLMAIITPDAVHCAVCRPSGSPVPLDQLDI